ncbi:MAG: hypothetical protein KGI07_05780 [Thaumarchaeota archaeon]|nr:hypothetical protein [Nitrososphaerota archaeon]
MRIKFLQLKISKTISIVLPVLVSLAIVGEVLPEDVAKFIVLPVLISMLLLSVTGALRVIRKNEGDHEQAS